MGLPAERVREIQKISQEPVSLDTPIGEEEDSQLGDFIEDDAAVVPPDAASFSMLQEQLGKVLEGLAERERKVISLRFGLEDGIRARSRRSGASSASRASAFARSRARRLLLRHPSSRSSKLKDYLRINDLRRDGVSSVNGPALVAKHSTCSLRAFGCVDGFAGLLNARGRAEVSITCGQVLARICYGERAWMQRT